MSRRNGNEFIRKEPEYPQDYTNFYEDYYSEIGSNPRVTPQPTEFNGTPQRHSGMPFPNRTIERPKY